MSKIEFSIQRTMAEDLLVADFISDIEKLLYNTKMNYHLLSLIYESAKNKEFTLQDYFTKVGELKEYNEKLKKHNKNAYEIGRFCDKLLVKLIDVEE